MVQRTSTRIRQRRRPWRIQAVVATRSLSADRRNRSSASAGVFQSSVFQGRELRAAATAAISLALCMLRSVPLGKYWRSSPLVFSLVAALPWAVRIAEIDSHARLDLEARLLGHLSSLIPSQRPAQLLGQCDDRARDGVTYRLR